jgi:hypothetical protein
MMRESRSAWIERSCDLLFSGGIKFGLKEALIVAALAVVVSVAGALLSA